MGAFGRRFISSRPAEPGEELGLREGPLASVIALAAPAEAARSHSENRRLSPEAIRLLAEPADESGHPLFI